MSYQGYSYTIKYPSSAEVGLQNCYTNNAVYDTQEGIFEFSQTYGGGIQDAYLTDNNGTNMGTGHLENNDVPQLSPGYKYVGSETDLWGATLTPEIVNSANFGLRLRKEVWEEDPYGYSEDHSVPLRIYNFGFDIPTGATITGVKVTLYGYSRRWIVAPHVHVGLYLDSIQITVYYNFPLEGGVFAETGQATTFKINMPIGSGSFVETGEDAELIYDTGIPSEIIHTGWQEIPYMFVLISGVWKIVNQAYVIKDGVWEEVYWRK